MRPRYIFRDINIIQITFIAASPKDHIYFNWTHLKDYPDYKTSLELRPLIGLPKAVHQFLLLQSWDHPRIKTIFVLTMGDLNSGVPWYCIGCPSIRTVVTLYRFMQSFLLREGRVSAILSQRSGVLAGYVLRDCSRIFCSSADHGAGLVPVWATCCSATAES